MRVSQSHTPEQIANEAAREWQQFHESFKAPESYVEGLELLYTEVLGDGGEAFLLEPGMRERAKNLLQSLSDREALVLALRFGIRYRRLSVKEMAEELGVTRERIYQIVRKALRKLRHPRRVGVLLRGRVWLARHERQFGARL